MSVVGQVWYAPWSVKEENMTTLRNQERTSKREMKYPKCVCSTFTYNCID